MPFHGAIRDAPDREPDGRSVDASGHARTTAPADPPRELPPLVGFDIETDTSCGGLDPRTSAVVATALAGDFGDDVLLGEERDILRSTDQRIAELGRALLVTWNGAGFDLPFVEHRARVLGVELGLSTTEDPRRRSRHEPGRTAVRARWHEMVHLDGYQLYRADVGRTLGLSCGLKPLARLVGLVPVELDRAKLHEEDLDAVARYVASDARIAAELVRRRMPAAITMADWSDNTVGDPHNTVGDPHSTAGHPAGTAGHLAGTAVHPTGAGSQSAARAARD